MPNKADIINSNSPLSLVQTCQKKKKKKHLGKIHKLGFFPDQFITFYKQNVQNLLVLQAKAPKF
jgi:hypothetical protein